MPNLTREQQRAKRAAELVSQVQGESTRKRYNTLVAKLPILIRTNGLLQTVAFLQSKAAGKTDAPDALVVDHLARHLTTPSHPVTRDNLGEKLAQADYPVYLRMQEEAGRVAAWHARFARALFGEPEDDR